MPHPNRILSRASRVDLEDLKPQLRVVELKQGQVLAESRSRMSQVYFPHSGVLSCVVELENGWAIESGMIGKDGVSVQGKPSITRRRCIGLSSKYLALRASCAVTTSKRWHNRLRTSFRCSSSTNNSSPVKCSRRLRATQCIRSNSVCANGSCGCTTSSAPTCRLHKNLWGR